MLLVHQTGSVKVGEVVRYTLTYTPAHDRILPTPSHLHVRIKNSSAIPLRAAYLHGPYTLYAACYPSTFDPNSKYDGAETFGNPQFEPQLKAGASWTSKLKIPEEIRQTLGGRKEHIEEIEAPSVTWIIEVTSQILFSLSANVHFEVVVGRDEKAIDFGFAGLVGAPNSIPGQLVDHQKRRSQKQKHHETLGVYSKAVSLLVEDTASLWNKPELPHFKDDKGEPIVNPVLADTNPKDAVPEQDIDDTKKYADPSKPEPKNKKRVHLVVITHGLHSNLGADMLYLKESIDAAAKQARLDKQMRRAKRRSKLSSIDESRSVTTEDEAASRPHKRKHSDHSQQSTVNTDNNNNQDDGEVSEDEEVIVRGFAGNATRTERGIQYLGKRLAKYVLSITYPDQPYLPLKKVKSPLAKAFSSSNGAPDPPRHPAHHGSTISKEEVSTENLAYQITSISFIGHSLGGLTQTYAIAYIHKHSPEFFKRIKPVNFVALASPFLGLSNENPIYVKFALDFGLVGRTGQDLGLTWRPPTLARSGWSAMIAGIGSEGQRKQRQLDPGSKPLLRILPAGPAHQVLRLFKNRTVYSNVVNDGVVPLRTSCLLFLDWRGLGRVDKARRGAGVIGTVANWGWAELTGANASEYQRFKFWFDGDSSSSIEPEDDGVITPRTKQAGREVPQPSDTATQDEENGLPPEAPEAQQFLHPNSDAQAAEIKSPESSDLKSPTGSGLKSPTTLERRASSSGSPLAGLFSLFKPGGGGSQHKPKTKRIYRRGQTMDARSDDETSYGPASPDPEPRERPGMARGDSGMQDPSSVFTPPATSIFESASDILNPPIPTLEYLTDPTTRPRTIFHDRVYHPDDIPAPPAKRQFSLRRNQSGELNSLTSNSRHSTLSIESGSSTNSAEPGSMKVEEKIARAYHRDLSWRKVLVRLEPDAHNNIVVRRMFANAYGWPVVKHLVDTHFSDNYSARTADELEENTERARPMDEPVNEHGEEVTERPKAKPRRASTGSSLHTSHSDEKGRLSVASPSHKGHSKPQITRMDSDVWDDRFFTSDSDDDEDEFEPQRSPQLHPAGHVSQPRTPVVEHDLDSKIKSPVSLDTAHVQPIVASKLTDSPKDTSMLGLQKSIEERIKTSTVPKAKEDPPKDDQPKESTV